MQYLRRSTWIAVAASLALNACSGAVATPTIRSIEALPSPTAIDTATAEAAPTLTATALPAAVTGTSASSALVDPTQLKSSLDTWVPAAIESNGGSACSVAVVYQDAAGQSQREFYSYGTLTKNSPARASSSTEYEIGSLTKLFTADILAQDVVDGKVALGDPIKSYLPSDTWTPSFNSLPITLEQLATHTSGLPQAALGSPGPVDVNGVPSLGYATDGDVMHWLSTYQLLRAPGQQWEYSDAAYAVLGIIEERVSNSTFDKLVQSLVAGPLGLMDTRVNLTAAEQSQLAQGYTAAGKKGLPLAPSGALLASAGLRSTAKDMAGYLAAHLAPASSTLEPALKLTLEVQGAGPEATSAMGLGWMIGQAGTDGAAYYKFGATDGYSAYIAMWPARQAGFVVLCNGQAAKELAPKITGAMGGANTPVDTNP